MLAAKSRSWLTCSALVVAAAVTACRRRSAPAVDWNPRSSERPERAAVLVLDPGGIAKVMCLAAGKVAPRTLALASLNRIWDVVWQPAPLIAADLVARDAQPGAANQLVLLGEQGRQRRIATGATQARFSPDGGALVYQTGPASDRDARATSYVLDLASGKLTELGALVDPRWDAEGRHLYATRIRTPAEKSAAKPGQWKSLRVRWERASGLLTVDGPGSAQVPAPRGEGVAWCERQLGANAVGACSVVLRREGGVRHSIAGSFCDGVADERGVRWSSDGRWLAFPHPGPVPGRRDRRGFYVDVVAVEGGRDPRLTGLQAKTPPDQLTMEAVSGPVWFDWSPSGRFLAVQDALHDLRLYDFEARATAGLGTGQQPTWSPGGAYLLVSRPAAGASSARAFVLAGTAPANAIDLGPARDARWLPPQACEGGFDGEWSKTLRDEHAVRSVDCGP